MTQTKKNLLLHIMRNQQTEEEFKQRYLNYPSINNKADEKL